MSSTTLELPKDDLTEMFFGLDEEQKGRSRGSLERSSGGRSQVRRASAGGLIKNALLTHQAVIKIVRNGTTNGGSRLGAQLQYISRNGALELSNGADLGARADGESAELVRDVIADWEKDFERMDPRTKFYTYHLIVSYPDSADQDAARIAGEAFAARLAGGDYGDRYKYVLAHHSDTRNPHTHIVINRSGQGGKTLHLSRHGIDIQSLRELHVETSRDVGIRLAATSRFSRGSERRSESLGRVKATADGRRLAAARGQVPEARYPFYGSGQRRELPKPVLERARGRNLESYGKVFAGLGSAGSMAEQRGAKSDMTMVSLFRANIAGAMQQLSQRNELERSDRMAEQIMGGDMPAEQARVLNAAAQAADPDVELGKINQDIRVFLDQFAEKIAGMTDETARTEADIALAKTRQQFEPLMDAETRKHFGGFMDRDQGPIARDDIDPVRQRQAAVQEAKDPDEVRPLDERGKAAQARLSEADQSVMQRFEEGGMSGKLALQRITSGSDVDKKTREMWLERDIKSHANTRNLSDAQARKEVLAAYRNAAVIYRDAREDIRGINRSFAEGRGHEAEGRATPSQDVTMDSPAPESQSKSPLISRDYATGVTGQIKETGAALYKADDPRSHSPYVDMNTGGETETRIWGVGLPDMLEREGLKVGDRARIYSPGSETVKVTETDPKSGEIREKETQRRRWEAVGIERAEDRTEIKRSVTPERERGSRAGRRNEEDRGIDR
ncbi:relaxase/mobilization nuclease domain-containing protein [Pelagibius sp. Alg239-R121]|uniref:relaxase/mobilization nuclease domain-containing protein n=1 Tax=Pelagibius sp. Alg239-R121 TaxID=2993448 RepID=UPI0024A6F283|nr:relaxase/mobilization nuclease domain-containing protein [Pelagibius sp. Alg239-R121]